MYVYVFCSILDLAMASNCNTGRMVDVLCMCCDCEVISLDGLLQLHVMHKDWRSWNVAVSMHPVSGFATQCFAYAGQSASK